MTLTTGQWRKGAETNERERILLEVLSLFQLMSEMQTRFGMEKGKQEHITEGWTWNGTR